MEATVENREQTKKVNAISHSHETANLNGAWNKLKNATSESVNRTKENVATRARNVDSSVRANAWTSIGGVATIAAVAGYLLGRNGTNTRGDEVSRGPLN